jgi:hypothetical protein
MVGDKNRLICKQKVFLCIWILSKYRKTFYDLEDTLELIVCHFNEINIATPKSFYGINLFHNRRNFKGLSRNISLQHQIFT